MISWFKKWFPCKHDPDMFVKIEEGDLTGPGGESRKVQLRLLVVKCKKCDQILSLKPAGIADDPVKGVLRNPEEPDEVHAELTEAEKKQLLEEIKSCPI